MSGLRPLTVPQRKVALDGVLPRLFPEITVGFATVPAPCALIWMLPPKTVFAVTVPPWMFGDAYQG